MEPGARFRLSGPYSKDPGNPGYWDDIDEGRWVGSPADFLSRIQLYAESVGWREIGKWELETLKREPT